MKEVKRRSGQQFRRFQDDQGIFYVECKKCNEVKPQTSEFFYKQKTVKSGLRSICKSCCNDYHMNRYENEEGFRERANELRREWYGNNLDRARETAKRSRETALAKDPKRYRKRNRENVKKWKNSQPAGIYKITCIENGRIYIGQSKCVRNRWTGHKSALRKENGRTNALLQEDWDKFGESKFKFEVIKFLPKDKDLLLKEEAREIKNLFMLDIPTYNSIITSEQKRLLQENK